MDRYRDTFWTARKRPPPKFTVAYDASLCVQQLCEEFLFWKKEVRVLTCRLRVQWKKDKHTLRSPVDFYWSV